MPDGAPSTPGGKRLPNGGTPQKGTSLEVGSFLGGFWWSLDRRRRQSTLKDKDILIGLRARCLVARSSRLVGRGLLKAEYLAKGLDLKLVLFFWASGGLRIVDDQIRFLKTTDWFTGQVPGGAPSMPGGKGLAKNGTSRKGTRLEVGSHVLVFGDLWIVDDHF